MPTSTPAAAQRSRVAQLPFYYGWVILALSGLSTFMSGPGQTYSVSVFVNPIAQEMGWSMTLISGMYTAGSLTAATTMVFVGRLLDRYGARVMLPIIGGLFGLSMIWMSNVSQPLHLYIGFAAIRTLGQGSLTLIPSTLVALWFVRLRGRAMALNLLGGSASLAAFPILIHLLNSTAGWRSTWTILAFIVWGALIVPTILLVRRTPESVGLYPDGDPPPTTDSSQEELSPAFREVSWTLGEALRTRTFWLLMFAGSSQSLISTALVFHHVTLLGSRGLDAGVAAAVLSVLAPASLVGTFVAGYLTDRVTNRYLLAGVQGILVVSMLLTFLLNQTWVAFAYGITLGAAMGAFMTTTSVIWPNYYGRAHLGSIRGVVTAGMVATAALGPLPFGWVFDLTQSYGNAVAVFLALPAACAVAALMATPPQKSVAVPASDSIVMEE
jgi:MFS family permease